MTQSTAVHPQLEKVARAIFRAGFHPDEEERRVEHCWNEWPDDRRASFTKARAAVQALMEPDEGMVDSGHDELCNYTTDVPEQFFVKAYQAMLRPLVEGDGE